LQLPYVRHISLPPQTYAVCTGPALLPKLSQAQFFSQVLERDRRFFLGELL